jgi:hypothetical protein
MADLLFDGTEKRKESDSMLPKIPKVVNNAIFVPTLEKSLLRARARTRGRSPN